MLNPADADFVARLAEALPEGALRELTPAYLEEPRGRYHGQGGALVAPRLGRGGGGGRAALRRSTGGHRALGRRHRALSAGR